MNYTKQTLYNRHYRVYNDIIKCVIKILAAPFTCIRRRM